MSDYPQQPQWQPTNPPVPPVKQSWFARHKVLSVILGIVLVVVLICCAAGVLGIGGDDSDSTASSETSSQTSTADESTEDSADETTGEAEEEPATEEEPAEEEPAEPEMSTEQANAVRSAENYLEFMPFSKQGLIDQLSSPAGDGYPQEVAVFAVEHIEDDVDWKEQAVKAAENYQELMGFSRDGLIQQLTSEAGDQYTQEQAEYAADQIGL